MSSNPTFNLNSEYNDIVDNEHYQYPLRKIQEKMVRIYWALIMNKTSRQNLFNLTYQLCTMRRTPKFRIISWCWSFVKMNNFLINLDNSLCISTKYSHQEIRGNIGVLRSKMKETLYKNGWRRIFPEYTFCDN